MLAQLAAALGQDGTELRIARDIGQFQDVIRNAVPEAFHHKVFPTIDASLDEPLEKPAGQAEQSASTNGIQMP